MQRFSMFGALTVALVVGWSGSSVLRSQEGAKEEKGNRPKQVDETSLDKALVELEKKAWEGVKNSDPNAMKALVTEDFLEVTESGRRNLQEALKSYAEPSPFKTYELSEVKVMSLSATSAVLSYRAEIDSASSAYVSAVYVNRGQGWRLAHWQATGLQNETVSIDAAGKVTVGNQEVALKELKDRLARFTKKAETHRGQIEIRAAAQTPYFRVVELMDELKRAGYKDIRLRQVPKD